MFKPLLVNKEENIEIAESN